MLVATRDAAAADALNRWVRSTRESSELRLQSEQMGRALLEWLRNGRHAADPRIAQLATLAPAPTWPVAFALAAAAAGACQRDAVLACAFSWAENAAQAAIKAVPIGQAAAQRLLGALLEAIPAAVDRGARQRRAAAAGARADARDPVGAARGAVLAAVPLVSPTGCRIAIIAT